MKTVLKLKNLLVLLVLVTISYSCNNDNNNDSPVMDQPQNIVQIASDT